MNAMAKKKIPEKMTYSDIPGLSKELAEKLAGIQPVSFAQACMVDGMTPAALMALSVWIKKTGVPRETSN